MTFEELGLLPELLKAVTEAGYTEPTPIQAQAIPVVLAGKDVMGGAQTGTGKTAGFVLPLLQRLARHASTSPSPARHPVRALILTPTRELAMQVHESVQTYGKHIPLRDLVVYGGVDIKPQTEALRKGVEIVVATPGRLLDHVQQKSVNFNSVEVLVLDEADRMLDMGFIPDIKRILAMLPKERQSLLFSATFSEEIKKLADTMLKEPVLIEVARRNAVTETVTHRMHLVDQDHKRQLLAHILKTSSLKQVLVFVGTKFGASRLAVYLEKQGIEATAIHGDKSQQQRTEALEDFKSGKARVLSPRRRRGRPRHQRPPERHQLRAAARAGGLHPPHRSHRPRRQGGRRHLARLRRGARQAGRDREAHQAPDRTGGRARLRTGVGVLRAGRKSPPRTRRCGPPRKKRRQPGKTRRPAPRAPRRPQARAARTAPGRAGQAEAAQAGFRSEQALRVKSQCPGYGGA